MYPAIGAAASSGAICDGSPARPASLLKQILNLADSGTLLLADFEQSEVSTDVHLQTNHISFAIRREYYR